MHTVGAHIHARRPITPPFLRGRRWEGGNLWGVQPEDSDHHPVDSREEVPQFRVCRQGLYHDLDPNEAKQWLYLEKFKMKLHTTGVSQPLPGPKCPELRLLLQPLLTLGPSGFSRAETNIHSPDFRKQPEAHHALDHTVHFQMHTRTGRYSEYLATCLLWKSTTERHWLDGAQA